MTKRLIDIPRMTAGIKIAAWDALFQGRTPERLYRRFQRALA